MENWKIFTTSTDGRPGGEQHMQIEPQSVIPVVQEEMHVNKQQIETGKVRVAKTVSTENVSVDVPVIQEEVIVTKKPVNLYIDTPPPGVRQEGDTTIISVVQEVLVKRLLLVEEVHITRHRTEATATVNETLRKEEVTVNRANER